jgi:hypothetical protein
MRNTIRILLVAVLIVLPAQVQLFAHSSTSELKASIQSHLDWEYPRQISVAVQDGGKSRSKAW